MSDVWRKGYYVDILIVGMIEWPTERIDLTDSEALKARLWPSRRVLLKPLDPIAVLEVGVK